MNEYPVYRAEAECRTCSKCVDRCPVKAARIGGPSDGCFTREHFDVPLDFDSLKKIRADNLLIMLFFLKATKYAFIR
jgi:ferredoxin